MNMTGNTILVTGATSGIGRALAEAFHDRGNRVVIAGRRQDKLDDIVAARPGMQAVQLDQNDPASLSRLAEAARTRFPELNVLVANAGISRAEDMTADDWNTADAEAVVNTNILGPLRVTAAVLPMLKLRRDATVVAGLRRDYNAIHAALALPWTTSPVEGQISRYGRAGFRLLRARVLHAA